MATLPNRFEGTPVAEAAAIGGAVTFGLMSLMVMAVNEVPAGAAVLIGLPIAASILACLSSRRGITWTAIGNCLGTGIITFFSVGIALFVTAICVFAWWLLTSRRTGQPVVTWRDLIWEAAGFMSVMVPLTAFGLI